MKGYNTLLKEKDQCDICGKKLKKKEKILTEGRMGSGMLVVCDKCDKKLLSLE